MNVNLDEFDPSLLLLVVPLVVIYFGLLIFAVVDLLRMIAASAAGTRASGP